MLRAHLVKKVLPDYLMNPGVLIENKEKTLTVCTDHGGIGVQDSENGMYNISYLLLEVDSEPNRKGYARPAQRIENLDFDKGLEMVLDVLPTIFQPTECN